MKRLHTILFVLVFSVMLAVPAAYAADDMVKKLYTASLIIAHALSFPLARNLSETTPSFPLC